MKPRVAHLYSSFIENLLERFTSASAGEKMSNGRQPFGRGVHTQHVSPVCGLSEEVGMIPPGHCIHSLMLAHKKSTRRVRLPINQRFARAQEVSVGSQGRLVALYPVFSPRVQLYQEVRQPSQFVLNQVIRQDGQRITGFLEFPSRPPTKFRDDHSSGQSTWASPHEKTSLQRVRRETSISAKQEGLWLVAGGGSHRDLRRLPVSLPRVNAHAVQDVRRFCMGQLQAATDCQESPLIPNTQAFSCARRKVDRANRRTCTYVISSDSW